MAKSNRITLTEVARQSGTSPMAVSVVLNGARSNTRVSDAARRRIMEVASDLNYSPNAIAQGLALGRTKTIGVLFIWAGTETVGSVYSMGVLSGILAGAAKQEYQALVYTQAWRDAASSSAFFSRSHTDGVILVSPDTDSDVAPGFLALKMPVVLLSTATNIPGVASVTVDNTLGVTLALDHLWDLGHSHIAYVGPQDSSSGDLSERYDAYVNWMKAHNLSHFVSGVFEHFEYMNTTREKQRQMLSDYLCAPNLPTAIFAPTDFIAVEVVDLAIEHGISVPEQLSVIGFDDDPVARMIRPKLTTVRQPLYDIGFRAAQCLIEKLEDKHNESDQSGSHILLPELIVRGSTAVAPK